MSRSGRHYVRPELQHLNRLPRDRSGDRAMKTTKPELEVPFDALTAWDLATYRAVKRYETAEDGVRAIATPVVVAYLRRLATATKPVGGPGPGDLNRLADELEAEA